MTETQATRAVRRTSIRPTTRVGCGVLVSLLFGCAASGAAIGPSVRAAPDVRHDPALPTEPLVPPLPLPLPALRTEASADLSPAPRDLGRLVAAQETGLSSSELSCGLFNPMPDGFAAGYAADTGLDLAGMRVPVFAIAAGKVDYAEGGHSLWSGPGDTDLAVRIELDQPIRLSEDRAVTHVWYAHLSALAFEQKEGASTRLSVKAGQQLGVSGRANGMWHLHLGLLLNGDTSQRWGSFLLEDEVRQVLCGLRARTRLPKAVRSDR